ncbi:hypothetical protein GIB67_027478 [Kingdonia uniflora]|uniref:Phytocyanin domain-containing protein n=1 Tax=Kingdonia uniflora TaxID=39325 RepID=A0A7J7MFF9_9MAGN|nr:hypothetical protein GIB67_027478 [Kingdonia uniflora]
MGFAQRGVMFFMVMAAVLQISIAATHNVEWGIMENRDYKSWAANKTFHVGDTIVFVYNPKYHNLLEVSHEDYRSCNLSSPCAVYTSGKTSITIKRRGHHFFICGFPAHCAAGMKVDINIPHRPLIIASPTPAPSPSHSDSVALLSKGLLAKVGGLVMVIGGLAL